VPQAVDFYNIVLVQWHGVWANLAPNVQHDPITISEHDPGCSVDLFWKFRDGGYNHSFVILRTNYISDKMKLQTVKQQCWKSISGTSPAVASARWIIVTNVCEGPAAIRAASKMAEQVRVEKPPPPPAVTPSTSKPGTSESAAVSGSKAKMTATKDDNRTPSSPPPSKKTKRVF